MSYEHRGLVIGVKQKLLYILPIFSYAPLKHPDVCHPTDHPDSKSNLFLLKASKFSFITHDSVLKLNDIRTASINRILYQQDGRIPPSSDTYKQIEKLVLQKYFPSFYHDYEQNLQTTASLNEQLIEAADHNNILEAENKRLKAERQISISGIPITEMPFFSCQEQTLLFILLLPPKHRRSLMKGILRKLIVVYPLL